MKASEKAKLPNGAFPRDHVALINLTHDMGTGLVNACLNNSEKVFETDSSVEGFFHMTAPIKRFFNAPPYGFKMGRTLLLNAGARYSDNLTKYSLEVCDFTRPMDQQKPLVIVMTDKQPDGNENYPHAWAMSTMPERQLPALPYNRYGWTRSLLGVLAAIHITNKVEGLEPVSLKQASKWLQDPELKSNNLP